MNCRPNRLRAMAVTASSPASACGPSSASGHESCLDHLALDSLPQELDSDPLRTPSTLQLLGGVVSREALVVQIVEALQPLHRAADHLRLETGRSADASRSHDRSGRAARATPAPCPGPEMGHPLGPDALACSLSQGLTHSKTCPIRHHSGEIERARPVKIHDHPFGRPSLGHQRRDDASARRRRRHPLRRPHGISRLLGRCLLVGGRSRVGFSLRPTRAAGLLGAALRLSDRPAPQDCAIRD